jgi:hypothetical protein
VDNAGLLAIATLDDSQAADEKMVSGEGGIYLQYRATNGRANECIV